jgi:flagellar biosynthesis/type III secretory pathway M-ring protein FliF/YscJ
MAEDNPIDTDFDDLNLDDTIADDLMDPINGLDDLDPQVNPSPNQPSRLQRTLTAIRTNRRYHVMAIILIGVAVLAYGAYGLFKKTPPTPPTTNQSAPPTFDSAAIVSKKEPQKKKRKIKYIDLYRQLENRQISPILRELSYRNIAYNIVQNGKQFDLQVDEDDIDEAKRMLAIKGMPSGTTKGYEIFDEASNLGVTEFDKRIRLIRALSGEMEKSIMEFDVVDYAYVEIVIPETKLFAVTQPPVTASILIKRRNGADINDETVYAIVQLVSNSVENLLPENISVVDTEGRVLSIGVLDRMRQKQLVNEKKGLVTTNTAGNGQVIIPAIEDVVDWFQLKFNYETVLEKKAINQLNGVLPEGSYKVAVTIDLNAVSRTGVPDIKKIVTSVVVDEQFDDVELTDAMAEQITDAVAGAVGFVADRDTIHISKAAFLQKRVEESPTGVDAVTQINIPQSHYSDTIQRLLEFWPIFAIGAVITTMFIIVGKILMQIGRYTARMYARVRDKWSKPRLTNAPSEEGGPDDANATDAGSNRVSVDVINELKAKANFSRVIQLKAIAAQELEISVSALKEMVRNNG